MTPTVVFILCVLAGTEEQAVEESAKAEEFLFGEEIVTIATRREQPLGEAPAAVTVINRDQIRSSGAVSIADLLRTVPGVNVIWLNPSYPIVTIRGFNPKALVLVDGREVTDPYFGITPWDFLSIRPEDIERIEVLRGASSALYGINAYAGVVNIVTRIAEGKDSRYAQGFGGYASMQGVPERLQVPVGKRSPTLSSASAGWTGSVSNLTGALSAMYLDKKDWYDFNAVSEEVAACRASGFAALADAGTLRAEAGISGGRLVYYQTDGGDVPARIAFGYGKVNYDVEGLSFQSVWNHYDVGASMARNILYRSAIPGGISANFNTFIEEARYLYNWKNILITTGGGDFRYVRYSSAILLPSPFIERRAGFFLQEEIKPIDRLTLTLGARYDINSIASDALSPRAALMYSPAPGHSIRVSWAQAFAKPNLVDASTISLGPPVHEDFPSVEQNNQKVTSTEAGYSFLGSDRVHAGVDAFYSRYRGANTILMTSEWQYPREGIFYDSYGVEGTVGVFPLTWLEASLSASAAAFYEARDVSVVPPDKRGARIDRAPGAMAHLTVQTTPTGLRWGPGSPSAGVTVHYISSYLGSIRDPNILQIPGIGNPVILYHTVGPYWLVDAVARYRWRWIEGGVIGRNILNNVHREFPGVSGTTFSNAVPGRTNYAGEIVPREIIAYITVML